MKFYEMECGCRFPQFDNDKMGTSSIPPIEIDFYNINYNCNKMWELMAEGKTVGVFQLEQSLGRNWSKKMTPTNLEDVSALVSIIRPGALKAKMEDNVTAAQHYINRKNLGEDYEALDPSIEDITDETFGLIIYQETAMKIAERVAKFTLAQTDDLRKAMGKKDAELMAKTRIKFIECCKEAGVITLEKANFLFDIIEKSNRYSFNKSHGISYGEIGLWCAMAKSHFPHEFFCGYMRHAEEKADKKEEIAILVNDAKQFKIPVLPPALTNIRKNFSLEQLSIRCGVANIAGIGEKNVEKLLESIKKAEGELKKPVKDFSWYEILLYISPLTTKTVMQNLICVGGFSHLEMYRKYQLFEYLKFRDLDDKDVDFLRQKHQEGTFKFDLVGGLRYLISSLEPVYSKTGTLSFKLGNRKVTDKHATKLKDLLKIVEFPSSQLTDDEEWINNNEEKLLGVPLTCMKLDGCNISYGNCTCADFAKKDLTEFRIAAQLRTVSPYIPKQGKLEGQTMAYIVLTDKTGSCEAVAFPAKFAEYEFLLFNGNTVGLSGKRTKDGSLQIDRVIQL